MTSLVVSLVLTTAVQRLLVFLALYWTGSSLY